MIITLRHLYYMSLIARTGSFRRAAEAAGVSQPVISDQIAAIEQHYGVRLFHRGQSGARPSELGWNYIRSADRILGEFAQMEERLKSGAAGTYGTISVGYYKSLTNGALRAAFRSMIKSHPDIGIVPLVAGFDDLARSVRMGALDLAVLGTEASACDTLKVLPLWSDRVMAVLPEDHKLAERDYLYWTDLLGEKFLFSRHDPGPDLAHMLTARLASPGRRPDITIMRVNREDVLNFVGIGAGVSLQCESAILPGIGVTFREMREGMAASRIGYSACWREDNDNPALNIFLNMLRNGGRNEMDA
ncbi:LysR family transcriptional regulator [Pelagibacterium luteolum]|uniref:DNA-binding transcriptional regulator, LysR family n=1 Tax=Pelagibacterium luteolum TaxID=440168 RepID=A0A1G7YIG8_9HYPH|nr:LysR family transcriptional regulator [Pelagibacterium luteolum]SDG96303.1 DNA-binding transcriptional regulator, LysR family [Pelagibacterium luteolum]